MVAHADLTGADLHEVKGADAATSGQILIADGAGSAAWAANEVDFIGFSAYDTTVQTAPGAATKKAITLDTEIHKVGVTHTGGSSEVTIDRTGFYTLRAIPQFVTTGGGAGTMEVAWEINTGSGFATIPGSPVRIIMAASSEDTLMCEVQVGIASGSIVRAVWSTNSAGVTLTGSTSLVGDTVPSAQLYITHHGK